MAEITITEENFEKEVLLSDKPVLLDFWAPWCGPCRMVAPVIEAIAKENENKIKVGKINVDEQIGLAAKFGVSAIPMIAVMKDGKVVNTSVGYRPKEQIEALLK